MPEPIECMTCVILEPINEHLPGYARAVYDGLIEPAGNLFWAGVGLWIVILLVRVATSGKIDFADVMKQSVYVLASSGLLVATDVLWSYSFEFTNTALFGLTKHAVVGAPDQIAASSDNIVGLAQAIEAEAMRVFSLFEKMMDDVGIYNLPLLAAGLLIIIPFLFLITFFLGHLASTVLTIGALTALGPILAAAFAFGPTRSITINAIRLALGQILRVFFAAFAIGITFFLVQELFTGFPLDADGELLFNPNDFLYTKQFWATIILGMLGVLFQWEAASLASNLAQTQISSIGPAMFGAMVGKLAAEPAKGVAAATGAAGSAVYKKMKPG